MREMIIKKMKFNPPCEMDMLRERMGAVYSMDSLPDLHV